MFKLFLSRRFFISTAMSFFGIFSLISYNAYGMNNENQDKTIYSIGFVKFEDPQYESTEEGFLNVKFNKLTIEGKNTQEEELKNKYLKISSSKPLAFGWVGGYAEIPFGETKQFRKNQTDFLKFKLDSDDEAYLYQQKNNPQTIGHKVGSIPLEKLRGKTNVLLNVCVQENSSNKYIYTYEIE